MGEFSMHAINHSDRPLFSLILPTKNRAHLIEGAIVSLLDQTLGAFEIVVIDNDDTDKTRQVISRISDPRVRYVRTGGLGMPQNWQVGLNAAVGNWILFIEDKWRAKKNLLELLYVQTLEADCELVSWKVSIDGRESGHGDFYAADVSVRIFDAFEFLEHASRGLWRNFSDTAPRMANCAVRRSLVERMESSEETKLCQPASPDYTSGYLMLGAVRNFVHLDSPLVSIVPNAPSTGEDTYRRAPGFEKILSEMGLKPEDTFSEVPAKYMSIHNSLMNDFIKCMRRSGLAETRPFHVPSYFISMADEAIHYLQRRVPFGQELELLRAAYCKQPLSVRHQIFEWNFRESLRGYSGCPDKIWTRMMKAIKRQLILAKGIL